jgi:hypothetical protein
MDKETMTNNNALLPEAKVGKVSDWGEMKTYLPKDIDPRHKKLLRAYFGGQLLYSRGKKAKARRRFKALKRIPAYIDFEDNNRELLILVDRAVKGQTRWTLG